MVVSYHKDGARSRKQSERIGAWGRHAGTSCVRKRVCLTFTVWVLLVFARPDSPGLLSWSRTGAVGLGSTGSGSPSSSGSPGSIAGDVVISFAYGYGVEEHAYFVGSLRGAGYSGAIELWVQTSKVSEEVREYSAAMNVTLHEVELGYSPWHHEDGATPKSGTLTMMVDRFTYLFRSCALYTGLCLFADFADVWFQRDPFRHLEPRARAADIVLEAEHSTATIKDSDYNIGWVTECWGDETARRVGSKLILNGGTMVIRAAAADRLFAFFSRELHHGKKICNDQGMVNVAFHTGRFEAAGFNAVVELYGTGVVNTVGMWDWHQLKFDGNMTALQTDGSYSSVVHQYNRHVEYANHLRFKAGCNAGKCPAKPLTSPSSDSPRN